MRRRGLLPADATMEGLAAKAAEGQAQFNSESGGGTAEMKAVQEQDEAGFEVYTYSYCVISSIRRCFIIIT